LVLHNNVVVVGQVAAVVVEAGRSQLLGLGIGPPLLEFLLVLRRAKD
jgi:hypothetical protein